MTRRFGKLLFHVACLAGMAAFLGGSAVLIAAARLCPYGKVQAFLSMHSNRTAAAFFTPEYYSGVLDRCTWAGGFLLASAGVIVWFWMRGIRRWPLWSGTCRPGEFAVSGWRRLRQALSADRLLLILLGMNFILRAVYLFQPACSDEVKGYYAFAARPFLLAVSDYRVPQHLLYTILSHPLVRVLGNAEWVIRLPAFVAGLSLPVLVYLAGRKWFGRTAGLVAAVLVTANPVLVHYSVNGRAYTLQACMVLLLWLAASKIAEQCRWRWFFVLIASGVAGLVAIPTVAYALAGTYTWILVAWLRNTGLNRAERGKCISRLVVSGIFTVWLGALAYLPAFVASDQWYSLDQDMPATGRIPWSDIPGQLLSFTGDGFRIWVFGIPGWTHVPFVILLLLGVWVVWKKPAFLLFLFNLLGIYFTSFVLGVIPYARTVLYLGSAFWMLVGAGIAFLLDIPREGIHAEKKAVFTGAVVALLAVMAANILIQNRNGFTDVAGDRAPGIRDAMRFLKGHAQPGDHITGVAPAAGPMYYYHLRNHMNCRLHLIPDEPLSPAILQDDHAVFFLVHTDRGLNLDYILRACRWGEDVVDRDSLHLVYSNRFAEIFQYQAEDKAMGKP